MHPMQSSIAIFNTKGDGTVRVGRVGRVGEWGGQEGGEGREGEGGIRVS